MVTLTDQVWRLVDLGAIEPVATQAVYEAAATAVRKGVVPDTLIVCWPESPLVCVGYFQEVEKEVDVDYCEKNKIPVVRRILGGGAVYLDSNQVFYQIVGQRDGRVIPVDIEAMFRKILDAPTKTLQELGVPAAYKPVNDIEVEGRKISGNGACEVDGVAIMTGNLILDFNYDEMTKILIVPDEKFRDKLTKSLRERVTTLKRELGLIPERQKVRELLVKHFEKTLGVEFTSQSLTQGEKKLLDKLVREKYLSRKWTYENSDRHPALSQARIVKISGRSIIGQGVYKSAGGLIRVTAEFTEGKVNELLISGDFTFIPSTKIPELERIFVNAKLDEKILTRITEEFYRENNIESPGTTPSDFARTILIASGSEH